MQCSANCKYKSLRMYVRQCPLSSKSVLVVLVGLIVGMDDGVAVNPSSKSFNHPAPPNLLDRECVSVRLLSLGLSLGAFESTPTNMSSCLAKRSPCDRSQRRFAFCFRKWKLSYPSHRFSSALPRTQQLLQRLSRFPRFS